MASLDSLRSTPVLDVHGAFIRRVNLSGTNLRDANLSHADCSEASFQNANFQNARLVGIILRGADLTGAKNLTIKQLASEIIDEQTLPPVDIDRQALLREIGLLRQPESAHS